MVFRLPPLTQGQKGLTKGEGFLPDKKEDESRIILRTCLSSLTVQISRCL